MRRLLAVLGRDVSRSRSPELHGLAAHALGLDVAYVPVSCADEAAFLRALDALEVLGARGTNVTLPYKRAALSAATTATATARAIGAANTVTFDGAGGREADNTDGPALLALLRAGPPERLIRPLVLGAGGAARAAVWALVEAGAPSVVVCARDPGQAAAVAAMAPRVVSAAPLGAGPEASLVVSSLPGDPALAAAALDLWIRAPAVLDLAYGPPGQPSALVVAARARGLDAEDGLALLIGQAALSLARWTGADAEAIRTVMARGFDSHSSRA